MSYLFRVDDNVSPYLKARRKFMKEIEWEKLIDDLSKSVTLYIGNLSFHTTEEQIYEYFNMVGHVRRVIMGLNRIDKTPCGFCFVEYYSHKDALASKYYLNGMKLDDRPIRIDIDPGFTEGRQYGRAKTGGQIRDFHRADYDPSRGGWGFKVQHIQQQEMNNQNRDRRRYRSRSPIQHDRYYSKQSRRDYSDNTKHQKDNPRFREREEDSDDDR